MGEERLTEQSKMWAHLFKNPHYIFLKISISEIMILLTTFRSKVS